MGSKSTLCILPHNSHKRIAAALAAGAVLALLPDLAQASTATSGLAWEAPLTTLQNSLTGPVARVIALLALAAAGAALVFGGEMGDFTRRIMMAVLGISVLLLGGQLVTTLFGAGAVV